MKIKGWELDYFNSGEWQVVDERLKDLEKANKPVNEGYNPGRSQLFSALRATPMGEVRVCILGQDPYPESKYATGLAFSIPGGIESTDWPPTLRTLLREYSTDLRRPLPSSGSLGAWAERGCLLWNAIPSCGLGKSLSHDWSEWEPLTKEILRRLSDRGGVVYALLGQVARRYLADIDVTRNSVVLTSHPSPRGSHSKTPFVGSRIFSTINDKLTDMGCEPMDWLLQ